MSDVSAKKTLRTEWSLLVESFIDDSELEVTKNKLNLKGLSLEFVVEQIKELSGQKKILFQKIEKIKNEIEQQQAIHENLLLVGSDTQEINFQLDKLQEQGQLISEEIQKIDEKLKKMRALEGQF
ncbi:MAG: hypothetical protein ACK4VO_02045 [Pseudobdellovibrio sp.]